MRKRIWGGRLLWMVLALALLVGLAACRQAQGGVPVDAPADPAPDVAINLGQPPLVMGPFSWPVTLTDAEGAPIEDATVTLRGDMNHAGMVPVEATATHDGAGIYAADFDWTMAGDWIVTVTARLADGREKVETHEFSVRVQ